MARVSMDMNYHPVEMSQLGGEINGEMSQLSGEMSQLGGRGDNEHNTQGISNEKCFAKGDEMSQLGGEMSQLSEEMSQLPEKVRIVREAKKVTEEYMESATCDLCANG